MTAYLLRQKLILFRIHTAKAATIEELAESFHVTQKTIRRDLEAVEEMAPEYGMKFIQNGKDYSLTVTDQKRYRERIFEITLAYRCQKNCIDEKSTTDMHVTTYMLLYPKMTVHEIASALYTSASTIRDSIKFARSFIDSYNTIENRELAFRLCYSSISSTFVYEKDNNFNNFNIDDLTRQIKKNDLKYNTQESFILFYYCEIALERIHTRKFIDEYIGFLKPEELMETKEYAIAASIILDCPDAYLPMEASALATLMLVFKEYTAEDLKELPQTWRWEISDLKKIVSEEIERIWGIDFSRFYETTHIYSILTCYYLKRMIYLDKANFLPLFQDNRFRDFHPIENAFGSSISRIFRDMTGYRIHDFDLYQLQNILFNKLHLYPVSYRKQKVIVSMIGGERVSLSYINFLKSTIIRNFIEDIRFCNLSSLFFGNVEGDFDILFSDIFIPAIAGKQITIGFQNYNYYQTEALFDMFSNGVIFDEKILDNAEKMRVPSADVSMTIKSLMQPYTDLLHPYNINYSTRNNICFAFVNIPEESADRDRIVLIKADQRSSTLDSGPENYMLFFFHSDLEKIQHYGIISHLFLKNPEYFDIVYNGENTDELIRQIKRNLFISTNSFILSE